MQGTDYPRLRPHFMRIHITSAYLHHTTDDQWTPCLRLNSHLRFFSRELLCELFSAGNRKKWVHNPLLNFSVHTIVDQIAAVNAPI